MPQDWSNVEAGIVSGFMRGERSLADVEAYNALVIGEFRERRGQVGGPFEGGCLLVLNHLGARTGARRTTPLVYLPVGDGWAIFATFAGAPRHPAWYFNLVAQPDISIEIGEDTIAVTASQVTGTQRASIWERMRVREPFFVRYESLAGEREIPVFLLRRRD